MQTGEYRFSCRFKSEAVLPVFKGSTLRGGLGHALRLIACALRRQECRDCLLNASCAYAYLFEVAPQNTGIDASSPLPAPRPHPYVLVPPDELNRHYAADDLFSFGITLFGSAINFLPHLVFAVQEMGKAGLGKGNRNGDGRFHLDAVYQNDQRIYDGRTLTTALPPTEMSLRSAFEVGTHKIAVTCHTPLRLKRANKLSSGLPFHLLIRAALRRISSLEIAYGPGYEPSLDYRGIVARAEKVGTVASTCRWKDIERYSNRQKSAMLIGGITGTMTYQADDLTEFIPLLRYCETVHLGKQTSFGLGRISVQTSVRET